MEEQNQEPLEHTETGARTQEKIRISVRNLVEFILRSGDIDSRRGGFAEKEAMQEGSRIHRKIQGHMGSNYQAEVPLSMEFQGEGYVLIVEGRADGIIHEQKELQKMPDSQVYPVQKDQQDEDTQEEKHQDEQTQVVIDEIKGMYRDVHTLEEPFTIHLAQAKCYAYIYGMQHELTEIGVQMTYCNLETEEVRRFRQQYSLEELTKWFQDIIAQYHKWAKLQLDWKQIRQASIGTLEFPFPWREGQKEVAVSVYRTMLRRKKLFIQAPTGTGKTISTIFPAVKAVGEGLADRIFYATAKTITRTVAEETFQILRREGLRLKSVTLTAKEKICFMEETECNPEVCPYAKGHFDRVNDAVFELVSSGERFDRQTIEDQARKWQVCPFEFGLDVSLWSDAVICDYNYIFDPRAKLKRFFGEGVKGEYLFLIDEAHNLVERGREMFSASLYKEDFLALKKEIQPFSPKMARALNRCNTWLLEQKRECEAVRVLPNVGTFPIYLMNLCGIMESFLEDSRNTQINEKVLELYFQVSRFLDTCDCLNENYMIYTELCKDGRFLIRLFCVDISENLQACLDKGKSTIYFSATFLPIQYYKSLLSTASDDYAIYARSTFDPGRRLVLIGTDTSSRYTNRNQQEYRKMAEYVLQVVCARRGNYMAFFSSYQMMESVAEEFRGLCLEQGEQIELLCQSSGMNEAAREEFLQQFEEVHENGLAGFCVMGGIFGEGIDLRHDRLIGAIIVGTGIPQVCNERELLKQFYDKRGEDGFFYAYLCPGMNKVLQSAGRVIRTEEDSGVILLLDERFASSRYRRMFPTEWEQPATCTLATVQEHICRFWKPIFSD
jgi:Rad3-related DNA helicase